MKTTSRNITNPVNVPDKRRISVVIPVAGFGSRMKSYGPKSLLKVKDDVSILDNQLKHLNKYFNEPEIILVTGFKHEKVKSSLKNRNVKIVKNEDWEKNNVAHSICLGLEQTSFNHVLIVYGDLVFNAWTLRAPFGGYSMLLIDSSGLMKKEEVGCVCVNKTVRNMMYDIPNKWAQIAYLTGKELSMFYSLCKMKENNKKFGFEIINDVIDMGGEFVCFSPPRMKITDIDSSKDLKKLKDIL